MTLEEAIEKANGGDVGAMESLGNYYSNENDLTESLKWYCKAADEGSAVGIAMSATLYKILGEHHLSHEVYDKAYICFFRGQKYAYDALLIKKDDYMTEVYNTSLYNAALIQCFVLQQKEKALNLIQKADKSILKARLLHGICLPFDDEKYQAEIYNFLSVLKNLSVNELKNNENNIFETVLFALAFIYLSTLLRINYNQIDSASEVLTKGYNCITGEDGRKMIADELSHYKKGLFGGYKYI